MTLRSRFILIGTLAMAGAGVSAGPIANRAGAKQGDAYELNDTHFHLTNYIQEGTNIHDFVKIMGAKVGRVALFGIPLQQQW